MSRAVIAELTVLSIGQPTPKQGPFIQICEEELQQAGIQYTVQALSTRVEAPLALIYQAVERILARLHQEKAVPRVHVSLHLESKNY